VLREACVENEFSLDTEGDCMLERLEELKTIGQQLHKEIMDINVQRKAPRIKKKKKGIETSRKHKAKSNYLANNAL
jgi:hypothetical protein